MGNKVSGFAKTPPQADAVQVEQPAARQGRRVRRGSQVEPAQAKRGHVGNRAEAPARRRAFSCCGREELTDTEDDTSHRLTEPEVQGAVVLHQVRHADSVSRAAPQPEMPPPGRGFDLLPNSPSASAVSQPELDLSVFDGDDEDEGPRTKLDPILKDAQARREFWFFVNREMSPESVYFFHSCKLLDKAADTLGTLKIVFNRHIRVHQEEVPHEVNIPAKERGPLLSAWRAVLDTEAAGNTPTPDQIQKVLTLLKPARNHVKLMVARDSVERFLKDHPEYKALVQPRKSGSPPTSGETSPNARRRTDEHGVPHCSSTTDADGFLAVPEARRRSSSHEEVKFHSAMPLAGPHDATQPYQHGLSPLELPPAVVRIGPSPTPSADQPSSASRPPEDAPTD